MYAISAVQLVIDNKNDLVRDTFCYQLFEENVFDEQKLLELLDCIDFLRQENLLTDELYSIINWIVRGVDICFTSHKDENDLYYIKNYIAKNECTWQSVWKNRMK